MSATGTNSLYLFLGILTILAITLVIYALVQLAPAVTNLAQQMGIAFNEFVASVESFSVIAFNQLSRTTALIATTLNSILQTVAGSATVAIGQVDDLVSSLIRQVSNGLTQVVDIVGSLSQSLFQTIVSFGASVVQVLDEIAVQFVGRVIQAGIVVIQAVLNFLSPLFQFLQNIVGWIKNFIIIPLMTPIATLMGPIKSCCDQILSLLQTISHFFSSTGSGILGFLTGIPGWLS